jgi:hypothetical protein
MFGKMDKKRLSIFRKKPLAVSKETRRFRPHLTIAGIRDAAAACFLDIPHRFFILALLYPKVR